MALTEQVVIAVTMPLLGYRVLEELLQISGMTVLGPVRTVEDAVRQGKLAVSTTYICDDAMTNQLLPYWPQWNGWIVRISTQGESVSSPEGPLLATISIHAANWPAQLRQLLETSQAPVTPPGSARSVSQRLERRRSQPHIALDSVLQSHEAATGGMRSHSRILPEAAAFDEALRKLPSYSDPTLILFVDLTDAAPQGAGSADWLDAAAVRLGGALRDTDVTFRLDSTLFAILAPCADENGAQVLTNRLQWTLCGSELIAPDKILLAGARWIPGTAIDQTVALAWQNLFERQARNGQG